MTIPNNHEEEHPMDTKSAPPTQARTQDVAPAWQPMTSAPVGDASACIDIWCADDDCRRTDCFWDRATDDLPDAAMGWVYETYDRDWGYERFRVRSPIAWMQTPAKPEGL